MNAMDIFQNRFQNPTILVTGGAGFIGGAVIRKLLKESDSIIFNIDKMGYASDLTSINQSLLGIPSESNERHNLLKVDLSNASEIRFAFKKANPDFVMHLAAESHVDRSITGPKEFINSNIVGHLTF